jgi:Zn-dependent protease with chaperone function
MMSAFELHAIAQFAAFRLFDSLAGGVVIGAAAALLLRISRRQQAGTRFAINFAALLAMALIPFVASLWTHAGGSYIATHPALVLPGSWAVYLLFAWGIVATWFLAGVVRAALHLHTLRKSCVPLDASRLGLRTRELLRGENGTRRVELCTSENVRVPTAVGLTKAVVILPEWVLEELSQAELDQVVLHELAHLRRWDDWTNLAQQIVKAFFFFHPAVWWMDKKLAFEREMACDDAVLAETASARAYAECLAHLAERSLVHRSLALAQAALGRVSQISRRVAQILDKNRSNGGRLAWKPAVSLMAAVAVVCAVGVSKMPRFVAFQEGPPAAVTATASFATGNLTPTGIELSSSPQSLRAAQRPVLAKFKEPAQQSPNSRLHAAISHPAPSKADGSRMVHLTGTYVSRTPVTQTVFIFISTGQVNAPDQEQIYQIQMWRLTVLKNTVNSDRHAPPRKET